MFARTEERSDLVWISAGVCRICSIMKIYSAAREQKQLLEDLRTNDRSFVNHVKE